MSDAPEVSEAEAPEAIEPVVPVKEVAADPAPATEAPPVAEAPEAEPEAEAPASWPDGWRKLLAGEDEKELKRLERMDSPKRLLDSYRALEKRMSSGEMVPKLGENPTEADIAAYREAYGIPETPDGYLEALPDGTVFSPNDEPLIKDFLGDLHAKNLPPEAATAALEWYKKLETKQAEAMAEADKQAAEQMQEALRQAWGGDYRTNIQIGEAILDRGPGKGDVSFRDLFLSGTMGDGTPIASSPEARQFLAQIAREADPVRTVVPSGDGSLSSVDAELDAIREKRRTDPTAYNDNKLTDRLVQLKELKSKLAARG